MFCYSASEMCGLFPFLAFIWCVRVRFVPFMRDGVGEQMYQTLVLVAGLFPITDSA